MIAGLDSASEPSAAQANAAKAHGVRLWSGYIATQASVGLYHPWPRSAFENARLCGGKPIAYASGWDDPVACKRLAAAWNVRLCLDIEGGIRGDGSWAQAWLDQSGAGVYGNAPVHRLRAPFHILAAYPGFDPKATWSPRLAHPSTPCGWQWQGTHSEFGIGVDRGWFDDFFLGAAFGSDVGHITGDDLVTTQAEFDALVLNNEQLGALGFAARLIYMVGGTYHAGHPELETSAKLQEILDAIKAIPGGSSDNTAVLAAIADLKAHPAVASDPTALALLQKIDGHFSGK